jgi:hypothetical protein
LIYFGFYSTIENIFICKQQIIKLFEKAGKYKEGIII